MGQAKSIGKREFIQHTSKYIKWVETGGLSLIITHHNEPDLMLTKIKKKSFSALRGFTVIKVVGDVNDPVLPGYDLW
ncbi:MAG: hypothetical protein A3E84_00845 [Gammaproteobacteria bacterium RIFCSPHIGHO2_12_FULL_42_13]|nr:MAG: hypothetical protein A3E84_00845 [Gammaproteobacteria bacterium RIFCSPHIGHO2_12_FULL_42_13]